MGSKSSTSNTTNVDNLTYNNTDINDINKSINNYSTKSIINLASNCTADSDILQNFDISGNIVHGNIDVNDISQYIKSSIVFNCIQESQVDNSTRATIVSEMMDLLSNKFNNSALSEIAQQAAAKATSQALSTSVSASAANNAAYIRNSQINNVAVTVEDIIQNTVENSFVGNLVDNCLAAMNTQQNFGITNNTVYGEIAITAVSQDTGTELLGECMQENKVVNETVNNVLTNLGFSYEGENINTTFNYTTQKAEAESFTQGILNALGELWSDIETPCIIAIAIIGVVIIIYVLFSSGIFDGKKGKHRSDDDGISTIDDDSATSNDDNLTITDKQDDNDQSVDDTN